MTNEQQRLWQLWRSGQLPFADFQQQFGEPVPDSVGRIRIDVGPITKARHDYYQALGREVAERIMKRSLPVPTPQHKP